MQRITNPNSPLTLLQQRLQYVDKHPERDWLVFTENVPQWPITLSNPKIEQHLITDYSSCNGDIELMDAICRREKLKYGLEIQREHVLVTNGALHGLSLIFQSYYKTGATVLCQAPFLKSTADLLTRYGFNISYFSTNRGEIDIEFLRKACSQQDVRFIYINSPHNPTGDVLSKDCIEQLVQLANEQKVGFILDSVYDSFLFQNDLTYSPLSFSENWEHVYTVNSMSKNYGSPGLRIGWINSSKRNIDLLAGLLEQETIAVCGIAQKQARNVIEFGNTELINRVKETNKLIQQYLIHFKNIEYNIPDGGTQFFIKIPVEDSDLFADYMQLKYGLVLTTSSNYSGIEGSFLRIPMVYPIDTTKRALELLLKGMEDFPSTFLHSYSYANSIKP